MSKKLYDSPDMELIQLCNVILASMGGGDLGESDFGNNWLDSDD